MRNWNDGLKHRVNAYIGVSALMCAYSMLGCLIIYNVTRGTENGVFFTRKQGISIVLCLLAALPVFVCSQERLKRLFQPVAIMVYALLWGLFVWGSRINGARGWYRLGAYSFQPAELAKPLFIVGIALLCSHTATIRQAWKRHGIQGLCLAGVLLPIMLQPDMGTILVYAVTFTVVVWVDGMPTRYLAALATAASALAVFAFLRFRHVRLRVTGFWDSLWNSAAASGYHAQRLDECLVKGGWTGAMFESSDALNALPYRYTDSLFAGAAELLGAAGIIPIVLLCLAWFFYCSSMAIRETSRVRRLIYLGAGTMVSAQGFIHLAVNLGLMPNTGIPLPFFSYGGSSLMSTFLIFSLVQRLQMDEPKPEENALEPLN